MLICSKQPMHLMDTYDCYSECISHIYSSRWILQLIKANTTLLGIAQIIEVFCINVKKAGWYLACACYTNFDYIYCCVFVMEQ